MSRPPTPVPTDLIAAAGGAVVLAAVLMLARGELAAAAVGGLAAVGLVLRWAAAPPLVLLSTAYFGLFPDGLPVEPRGDGGTAAGPRLLDLVAAAAGVAFAAGHYRRLVRLKDGGDELPGVGWAAVGGAVVATLAGVAALALVSRVRPDYARGPLRFVTVAGDDTAEQVFARFVMLAGLLGFGTLLAAGGLWLARLNRLSPGEARQLLLDARWQEGRREFARLETWRAAARATTRGRRSRAGCWVAVLAAVGFAGTFWLVLALLR